MGLIPLIRCHHDVDFEHLWRLRNLAKRHPALSFLCLDSMTHRESFEEALGLGEDVPNVFFDITSSVLGPEAVCRFVDRLGADRLLFGTNLYSMQNKTHASELDSILAADISEDARRSILGRNARRLFNLSAL